MTSDLLPPVMVGAFSTRTDYYAGVLRPDGKAVAENTRDDAKWTQIPSLGIAGFPVDDPAEDTWEAGLARNIANTMTDDLVERGVAVEAAQHSPVVFVVVTQVSAHSPVRRDI